MKEIESMDWNSHHLSIQEKGYVHIPSVLSVDECKELRGMYDQPGLYRSVINMQRYRFGKGEYKYFSYPLPQLIEALRKKFYERLAPLANQWMQQLNIDIKYPAKHEELIEMCQSEDQLRPTPLILKYSQGGFNTLHQDLYGEVYFPFQIVFVLT